MNLIISELTEHKKILDKFKELPADLRKYVQTFYKSTMPVITCPYCSWATVPSTWSIYTAHHFCCAWGRLNIGNIYH